MKVAYIGSQPKEAELSNLEVKDIRQAWNKYRAECKALGITEEQFVSKMKKALSGN